MASPNITFFCEAQKEELERLFNKETISVLKSLNARISMGILDMTMERAAVVTRLNNAGIPVTAWLLLPKEQGYWLNSGNFKHANTRYRELRKWTTEHGLRWRGIGLDFEPDIRELEQLSANKLDWLKQVLPRLVKGNRLHDARNNYSALIEEIHRDGYKVETYQIPVIADERRTRSTTLQKMIGMVDLTADTEVMMLYTSLFRPHGPGILASFAPEAHSIGIGSTGGGVELDIVQSRPLEWNELERDLRLAWYWCDDIYIFSLEGCIQQNYLRELAQFKWDYPIILPVEQTKRVNGWRSTIRSVLWVTAHPGYVISAMMGLYLFYRAGRRLLKT